MNTEPWQQRPLTHISVWITRPGVPGERLCAAIRELGGQALHLPAIQIEAPELGPAELEGIDARARACTQTVFVSGNAVCWAIRLLPERTLQALRTKPTYAPGAATAAALRENGFLHVNTAAEGSESLLGLPTLSKAHIAGQKIVIFRAEGGRELLRDSLNERGAETEYAEIYRRVCPRYEPTVMEKHYQDTRPDLILVSSRTGLRNLRKLFPEALLPELQDTHLLTLSERIAALAKPLGFRQLPIVSPGASEANILRSILRYAATAEQKPAG